MAWMVEPILSEVGVVVMAKFRRIRQDIAIVHLLEYDIEA